MGFEIPLHENKGTSRNFTPSKVTFLHNNYKEMTNSITILFTNVTCVLNIFVKKFIIEIFQ